MKTSLFKIIEHVISINICLLNLFICLNINYEKALQGFAFIALLPILSVFISSLIIWLKPKENYKIFASNVAGFCYIISAISFITNAHVFNDWGYFILSFGLFILLSGLLTVYISNKKKLKEKLARLAERIQ